MLTVPFAALTAFADPHVRFGLRFQATLRRPPRRRAGAPSRRRRRRDARGPPQVVSLDAFRRRPARD